jgi:hypothetical protein
LPGDVGFDLLVGAVDLRMSQFRSHLHSGFQIYSNLYPPFIPSLISPQLIASSL